MKLALLFAAAAICSKSVDAAINYAVDYDGADTPWGPKAGDTNTIKFSFSKDGGSGAPSLDATDIDNLEATVHACSHFSADEDPIGPTGAQGVSGQLTVSFDNGNDVTATGTCYCALVKLRVKNAANPHAVPKIIASSESKVCVTATDSGTIDTITHEFAALHLDIDSNSLDTEMTEFAGDAHTLVNADIHVEPDEPTPYDMGDDIPWVLTEPSSGSQPGYYYKATDAKVGADPFGSIVTVGYTASTATHYFTTTGMANSFYFASIVGGGSTTTVTFTIDWWVNDPGIRRLTDQEKYRELQDGLAGTNEVTATVKLNVPDESGAPTWKVVSVSAVCLAAGLVL